MLAYLSSRAPISISVLHASTLPGALTFLSLLPLENDQRATGISMFIHEGAYLSLCGTVFSGGRYAAGHGLRVGKTFQNARMRGGQPGRLH